MLDAFAEVHDRLTKERLRGSMPKRSESTPAVTNHVFDRPLAHEVIVIARLKLKPDRWRMAEQEVEGLVLRLRPASVSDQVIAVVAVHAGHHFGSDVVARVFAQGHPVEEEQSGLVLAWTDREVTGAVGRFYLEAGHRNRLLAFDAEEVAQLDGIAAQRSSKSGNNDIIGHEFLAICGVEGACGYHRNDSSPSYFCIDKPKSQWGEN